MRFSTMLKCKLMTGRPTFLPAAGSAADAASRYAEIYTGGKTGIFSGKWEAGALHPISSDFDAKMPPPTEKD